MSRETEEEKFYNAVEETSRMMGVPFDRDKVRPLLTGYRGAFAEGNGTFMYADERHAGELNYAITVPPEIEDPYAHAVSHGFVVETGHPTATLLSDVRAQASVAEHFCDCGVVGGFRKLYAHFPHDLQEVAKLAEIPSMPPRRQRRPVHPVRHGEGGDDRGELPAAPRERTSSSLDTRPEPDAVRAMLRRSASRTRTRSSTRPWTLYNITWLRVVGRPPVALAPTRRA